MCEALVALNTKTWDGLTSRKHNIVKGFALSPNADEVMLHGFNEYIYDDGSTACRECGFRMRMSKTGGRLQIAEYQSYLVSHHSL